MTSRHSTLRLSIALVAVLGAAGALLAAPQHQEHHPGQAIQEQTEDESATQMQSMCSHMSQQMMTEMHNHMAMMQQMMAHTHGASSEAGHMGEVGMAEPAMMGAMMQGMMEMLDPGAIEDPAEAEKQAGELQVHAQRMQTHLERMQQLIEALRKRAEELRTRSQ